MSDVTQILQQIEDGDPSAAEQLLPLVYEELRKLAAARMVQESPDHTLQATALVHEAYVRLVDNDRVQHWDSRGHFFVAAAEAMRRILVECARSKARAFRGIEQIRLEHDEREISGQQTWDEMLALNTALEELATEHQAVADVVNLRYFTGLTIEQVAELLGISVRTANRHWAFAKAWLFQQLQA